MRYIVLTLALTLALPVLADNRTGNPHGDSTPTAGVSGGSGGDVVNLPWPTPVPGTSITEAAYVCATYGEDSKWCALGTERAETRLMCKKLFGLIGFRDLLGIGPYLCP
jgi:hypothetical protein